MEIVALIPARFGSTRLPGKPLCDIGGRPMIQHVYERARRARLPGRVLVATDDARIADVVRAFGGEAVLTSADHPTGTDRLAEAARALVADVILNVQGDEPLLDPAAVDAAARPLVEDPGVEMATVSVPLLDEDEVLAASVVKVVCDGLGDALLFSRAPIPHVRSASDPREGARETIRRGLARRHLGLYAYRRETLLRLASLPPAPLEEAESLEQLRALHHGIRIRVVAHPGAAGPAVDTAEDLERVRALVASPPPAREDRP